MRKLLLATTALLALSALPAKADVVVGTTRTGSFTSDHCECANNPNGPAQTSFATISATQGTDSITFAINLLHGNTFTGGGFDASFGFNLDPNQTITYSGLPSNFEVTNPTVPNGFTANASSIGMDGFGAFEYGVDYTGHGSSGTPPTSLTFTISGAGLTLDDLAQLSNGATGDTQAYMVLDIFSGTNGNTGLVDLSQVLTPTQQSAVPEPSTWAMMILGFLGVGFMAYRRRNQTAAFRIA